ncbi:hypothetical protein ACLMJK_007137 [Lecanora helva]
MAIERRAAEACAQYLSASYILNVLLLTLWEFSNRLFGVYVAQEPLKKGQPLTSESKDPNGTLLIGLQVKREVLRSFAFWELSLISQNFEARRKAIFSDIDRPNGSAWNQIMTLCLGNILAISNRIAQYQNPTPATSSQQQDITIETLPRITTSQLRQDNIFTNPPLPNNRREMLESRIGTITKSYGQSPQPATPLKFLETQSSKTGQYLHSARQKLLTQEQQDTYSKSGLAAQYNDYLMRFLRSPAGHPFRQTLPRRIRTVALGSPYSTFATSLSSIHALSSLAKASISEDPYGNVAKDIPLIIRAFVSTISSIQGFVKGLQPHWTDVEFSEGTDREVEEVEMVVGALKEGLKGVVEVFGGYADELGLGREELSAARRVAGLEE